MSSTNREFQAIVAGAGPAGLAAACLLAKSGCTVACISPDIDIGGEVDRLPVRRTVALMQPAIRLLEMLEVWPVELKSESARLKLLKIVDDTLETFSAPALTFAASELNLQEFGWNIPLPQLVAALTARASELGVTFARQRVSGLEHTGNQVTVRLEDGSRASASVLVAADGRQSVLRRDAGIATSEWTYDQVALALSFAHSGPHNDMSIEYHKASGPFTTVPLPGRRSSLVWMVKAQDAAAICALSEEDLAVRLQLEMHGDLGLVTDVTAPVQVPMAGMSARKFASGRVLLVGEAAHVVPPIGAQGLNMSLRDAAYAAELIGDAMRFGDDLGSASLCEKFDTIRKADVLPRQAAIDTMNRSLTSQFLPLHLGRAIGMSALQHIPPLRRRAMIEGINPSGTLPRAMRG